MSNGTNDEYHEFDEQAVSATLEASRQPFEGRDLRAVSDNKVCLKLPLGIGQVCIPVPFDIPDGSVVRACLSIRTKWGIPTGVCVKLYVAGEKIASKCFP